MKNFKGTKGKWKYEGGDNSSIDIVLDNNSTISIDRYDRYGSGLVGTREEMNANALLISKAPEMLEMLEELTENLAWQLDRLGVCGQGDGKGRKADVDSYGGTRLIEEARKLITEATEL